MTIAHEDSRRTARLHLDAELVSGTLRASDAVAPEVLRLVPLPTTPALPIRIGQRLAMKLGLVDPIDAILRSGLDVRRAALGDDARAPPRLLVRVDEFPIATAYDEPTRHGIETSKRFHEVMAEEDVPYLLAVVPQLTARYLDPDASGGRALGPAETTLLEVMKSDLVHFAQHGATHRTRFTNPRKHSELSGLDSARLAELLDGGLASLESAGLYPRVLVPPFNRFGSTQWATLAARYTVITGGPETVAILGLQPAPTWWGNAVYLPCYSPLYSDAATILRALDRVLDLAPGTWVPIVLHVAWEAADRFRSLARLARHIAPYATPWETFLAAVDRSAMTHLDPPC